MQDEQRTELVMLGERNRNGKFEVDQVCASGRMEGTSNAWTPASLSETTGAVAAADEEAAAAAADEDDDEEEEAAPPLDH